MGDFCRMAEARSYCAPGAHLERRVRRVLGDVERECEAMLRHPESRGLGVVIACAVVLAVVLGMVAVPRLLGGHSCATATGLGVFNCGW